MKLCTLALVSALLLSGCTTSYPLGYTKEEWDSLPPHIQQRVKDRARAESREKVREIQGAAAQQALAAAAADRANLNAAK